MVACFPDQLAALLDEKCPPAETHTVVLWTKNPTNLLQHDALRHTCSQYPLYVHFTITGLGATALEPNVPSHREMLNLLEPLIAFLENPARIRIRFDPIVHLKNFNGRAFSNLKSFEEIACEAARHGIRSFSTSWMCAYKKVISRLHNHGFTEAPLSQEERNKEYEYLLEIASKYDVSLYCCGMPGMPTSRCIDGKLLSSLHPGQLECSTRKAKGQRATCGCTESFDIGWYFQCPHGCLYCYANPASIPDPLHEYTSSNN
jgi:DNA repair photolyase